MSRIIQCKSKSKVMNILQQGRKGFHSPCHPFSLRLVDSTEFLTLGKKHLAQHRNLGCSILCRSYEIQCVGILEDLEFLLSQREFWIFEPTGLGYEKCRNLLFAINKQLALAILLFAYRCCCESTSTAQRFQKHHYEDAPLRLVHVVQKNINNETILHPFTVYAHGKLVQYPKSLHHRDSGSAPTKTAGQKIWQFPEASPLTILGGRTCPRDRCYRNLSLWRKMKLQQGDTCHSFTNIYGFQFSREIDRILNINHLQISFSEGRHFASLPHHVSPKIQMIFSPYRAVRIGEAQNPGPNNLSCGHHTKMIFANPTAVNKKVPTLLELQPDILCLAETSATQLVQQASTAEFRSQDFASLWAPPVPPHAATIHESAAFRGAATGVSIHAKWPLRPSRIDMPAEIDPLRFISGIVEIGIFKMHIITLYGYPKPQRDAHIKTDKLIAAAARAADEVGLPTIIIGDFNHPPEKIPAVRSLKQIGYLTTADLYQQLYNQEMPKTCREATCNDQAILHPDLIPYISQIRVDKDKLFGDHDPVELLLKIPEVRPCKQILRTPKTWTQYEPEKFRVEDNFISFAKEHSLPLESPDQTLTPDALKLWAMGVEASVKKAIYDQHLYDPDRYPQPLLPKECLGRANDIKIKKIPFKVPIKTACAGQYTPATEATTFRIKMKTRQVRRLQSLRHRIVKVANYDNQHESTIHALNAEWRAITRAQGFRHSFPSYCLTHPDISYYPMDFPSVAWLDNIIHYLCQEIDQEIVIEKKKHRDSSKFALWYDQEKDHLQSTLKQVKKVTNHILNLVAAETTVTAKLKEDDFGLVTLHLSQNVCFRHDRLITYGDLKAQIQTAQGKDIVVMFLDDYDSLPPEAIIKQMDLTSDPDKISTKLSEYWNQFWRRDSAEDMQSTQTWDNFQRYLDQCPKQNPMQLDLCDIKLWKQAIATTKITSAKGTDGWTVKELRELPDVCIQVLANIFASIQGQSFPPGWCNSITIPIGKTDSPESPSQTRPITLIPMLYRWWTKVVTKQILKHWGQIAPPGLIGFLPTRSAQIELMSLQWQFEKAHAQNAVDHFHWQGLTLDLVKCFNLIPRLPSYRAMIHFGIPKGIVDIWFNTLTSNIRWWKVQNQIWCCGPSTTGAPEGDTWSILACLSLSWVWQHHITSTAAKPMCYADNWGWKTKTTESNLAAIQITRNITDSLRLQIDWNKTWAWTTQTTGKKKWATELKTAVPALTELTVVTHARELGYMISYNKVSSRETQMKRHLDALAQLKKLKRVPVSLDSKALISTYAMHKALYGTETYAVGQNWIKELRSAMAKAIVSQKQYSNPHLAVMMLSRLVIDPELYLIRQSLTLCRKMLMQFDESEKNLFLQYLAKHTGDFRYVRGPAGSLKLNLQRLGWSIASNGQMETDSVVTFHILRDSIHDILKYLEFSWLKHVTQTCLTRVIWRNYPVPNRAATLRVLRKLPPLEQRIASYAITGAFMMSNQSQHFTERDNTCDLCDAEDSTEHRLMHCPQTNHLCHEHQELIQFLQDHHPCHYEIPVIYLNRDFDFNWFFFANRPAPVPSAPLIEHMRQRQDQGKTVVLFTDGSCIRPAHPWHRRAAFAVVLAISEDEHECVQDVITYKKSAVIPRTFQTLAVGECLGLQTIPRAELQALAFAANLGVKAIVYTDSAYALDVVSSMSSISHFRQMANMRNLDIILPLWETGAWKNLEIRKVKSHELDKKDDSFQQTWVKLGNEAADLAAKAALTKFTAIMPMHQDFDHHEQTINLLAEQFSLRAKQQTERAKCYELRSQQAQLPIGALTFQPQLHELNQWAPKDTWSPTRYPQDAANLELCTWTTSYGDALLDWLTQLKWPIDQDGNYDITWFEMAFAFQTAIQSGLIYNNGGQGRFFQPRWAEIDDTTVRYGKQVLAFERCVEQLQKLLGRKLIPERKSNCTTVMVFGANHYRPGLQTRPIFPHQHLVNDSLRNYYATARLEQGFSGPPRLPEVPATITLQTFQQDSIDQQQGWHKRVARQRLFLQNSS